MVTLASGIKKGQGKVGKAMQDIAREIKRTITSVTRGLNDDLESIWDNIRDFFRPEESPVEQLTRETNERFDDLAKEISRRTDIPEADRNELLARLERQRQAALAAIFQGGMPISEPGGLPDFNLPGAGGPGPAPIGGPGGSVGAGAITINLNFLFPPPPSEARRIAESIGGELVRWMRDGRFLPQGNF
jgi:hypothetical protein